MNYTLKFLKILTGPFSFKHSEHMTQCFKSKIDNKYFKLLANNLYLLLLCRPSYPTTIPLSFRSLSVLFRYFSSPWLVCTITRSFICEYPGPIWPRRPAVPNSIRWRKSFDNSSWSFLLRKFCTSLLIFSFCKNINLYYFTLIIIFLFNH